jgi:hypothetical protein
MIHSNCAASCELQIGMKIPLTLATYSALMMTSARNR